MLSCKLNPSIGFIIFGHQSMECRFTQNDRFPPQAYEGALNTVGIDLGVSAGGVLGWAVLAPTAGPPPGALAGEYVGATGEIGLGLGAGVNVLMGGSGRSFALQPVSLQGSVAVNVTLGLSGLQLRADRTLGTARQRGAAGRPRLPQRQQILAGRLRRRA